MIKFIFESLWKLIKFLFRNLTIVIYLAAIAWIVYFFMTVDERTAEQKKNEKKPDYIPVDITKKYPEDFKAYGEFVEKVKKNAVKSDKKIEEDRYHAKYYDSKGREIYSIDELWGIQRNNWHSGRGGGSQERAYPKEEGILYDENGNIAGKLEINPSTQVGYISRGVTDEPRRSLFETGYNPSKSSYTRYSYDKNSKLIKEIKIKPSNWFEKEEIEYKNGKKKSEKKIIDYEVTYEDTNKIYVEITKEYDKDEKLIKKFVLRKNKHNAMRSETNFDFIKGEIVTKYYDGEKAFATVTEILIGKDRAIVKREREGDEVKIFDYVEYISKDRFDYKKYKKYFEFLNRRYISESNLIQYIIESARGSYEYNEIRENMGIELASYKYESFYMTDNRDNYGKISSVESKKKKKMIDNYNYQIDTYRINKNIKINLVEMMNNIRNGTVNDEVMKYLEFNDKEILNKEILNKQLKMEGINSGY